ncbi:methylenetetrahydrofolate reductase [Pseudonocardia sp. ICBG1293]|uniref:methylenetetrahydrofolate reductase n=1 Tax=Pseudonocardia sp. ICBG1293 TaxID=2844382 RepID=UPI001CCBD34A|nr:methylenetetrahydrofolate reductase [Pseudonocardia sp. ICBG1293]
MTDGFRIVCEIEPPTRPDLTHARHQIGVLSPVAHSFLIPDNHLGRATVSSIAVANEVRAMGGTSIACVNSRDRNLLGFRRDLLTAAAYGVDQFLFVQGDKPSAGDRTGELTVRAMIEEARAATDQEAFAGVAPFRLGVTAGHRRRMAAWKQEADFVFIQVGFSVETFLRWREANPTDLPVYAGVMVLASPGMATRLRAGIPDIDIPDELVDRVTTCPTAGVDAACEQIEALRDTGAFAGVHLVPVSRFREVAAKLERQPLPRRNHPSDR